jgi:hypothetical protein
MMIGSIIDGVGSAANVARRRLHRGSNRGALGREGLDLALPIADYIGISLDGYRISPSVARIRAERVVDDNAGRFADRRPQGA